MLGSLLYEKCESRDLFHRRVVMATFGNPVQSRGRFEGGLHHGHFSFYMVAELVIWNNDVFNGEFLESPREREACEISRWNLIISTKDAVG